MDGPSFRTAFLFVAFREGFVPSPLHAVSAEYLPKQCNYFKQQLRWRTSASACAEGRGSGLLVSHGCVSSLEEKVSSSSSSCGGARVAKGLSSTYLQSAKKWAYVHG